jgi:hypothetical protein
LSLMSLKHESLDIFRLRCCHSKLENTEQVSRKKGSGGSLHGNFFLRGRN